MPKLAVMIATKSRPELLKRTLASVAAQTRKPETVIVVGENSSDFPEDRHEIESGMSGTEFTWLINKRTKNMSGALNTAIQHLVELEENPNQTYLAFLDDDDQWEQEYLHQCYDAATKGNFDLVIAGIILHKENNQKIIPLSIPSELNQEMFYVGNPHIQGSSLFVKMSTILRAGCFDENLPSTTDRDIMVRLLDLGDLRWQHIDSYLVHHNADDRPRLSSHGSHSKLTGLSRFFEKYKNRMTADQKTEFKKRAAGRFGWNGDNQLEKENEPMGIPQTKSLQRFSLTIGFTATHLSCVQKLLQDLAQFIPATHTPTTLVVVDNTTDEFALKILLSNVKDFIKVRLVTREELEIDADNGKLGNFYIAKNRRKGVSYGRTALHRYLYLEGKQVQKPVFWILDDDMRLDIAYGSLAKKVAPEEFISFVSWLVENRVAICVGGIYGDPPLPIAGSIRVQLLELDAALRESLPQESLNNVANSFERINDITRHYPEAYYDISIANYDHLELPLRCWEYNPEYPAESSFEDKALAIKDGRNLLRPSLPHDLDLTFNGATPNRGGNTIVTDLECLRTYPNASPHVNNVELRRGDTLWVMLNECLGGEIIGFRNKQIMTESLFIRQERAAAPYSELLNDALIADIIGGAFVRAFRELIQSKSREMKSHNFREVLTFTPKEIQDTIQSTRQNIKQRSSLLEMDAWRIRGLIGAMRKQLETKRQLMGNGHFESESSQESLQSMLHWLDEQYNEAKLSNFAEKLLFGLADGIGEFMSEFLSARENYAKHLSIVPPEDLKEMAAKVIKDHYELHSLEIIGIGQEGIVFTDGRRAYKYFICGTQHFNTGSLDFIREKLSRNRGLKRIVCVEEIFIQKDQVIIVSPLTEGDEYRGGHLEELIELLAECRRNGIVLTNVLPYNLKVGKDGLVYVDIGRSIIPFDAKYFREMCKRVYLTYRYHFRKDLKELLTKSLNDEELPELYGFDYFLQAIEPVDIHEQMDEVVISTCVRTGAHSVLDYGCGSGTIADKLTKKGMQVSCYDIDSTRFCGRSHIEGTKFLSELELQKQIDSGVSYDLVLCNLVLCSIEDRKEVLSVLKKIRKLTSTTGRAVVGICNPLSDSCRNSISQTRQDAEELEYGKCWAVAKKLKSTSRFRKDWHRPIRWYIHAAHLAGLEVEDAIEVPSIDIDSISPSSDQLILVFRSIRLPTERIPVSLMIKACSMEWETIELQVKHIVNQLEGPQKFFEKILVTDDAVQGFARQYAEANMGRFQIVLRDLVNEGIIDRIVVAPTEEDEIRKTYMKWFGLAATDPRAANGQPLFTTLYGFDHCQTDYVLQLDSDCLIRRASRDHDYLSELLSVFEADKTAVTVSMPIPYEESREFEHEGEGRPFRTEVRCCLINRKRIQSVLPLENRLIGGILTVPWHRAADDAVNKTLVRSYRGGNPQTSFVHIPNARKQNKDEWYNIMMAIEEGALPSEQLNKPELVGEMSKFIGIRKEPLVILLRGRDVSLPKIRRCLDSLLAQEYKDWGAVFIDAASTNGTDEFCRYMLRRKLGKKLTLFANLRSLTAMENIHYAISQICQNPNSIIIHLDLDDALIGKDALTKVVHAYELGADATVGSMLRTDKHAKYPASFKNSRNCRGGNVWQHLKTFRKYLYDKIPEDYFKVDGKWIPFATDWAMMLPVIELARKPKYIEEPLYFYEPSQEKLKRSIEERERMIGRLVAKPSLKVGN